MEPNWSKLDRELQSIYSNYLRIKDEINLKGVWIHSALKNGNKEIGLTLQYQGSLNEIEKIGFNTQSVEREGVANGMVNIDILPKLSNHPSVIKLSYGAEFYPMLDTSVLEILARGSTAGINCVWSVNQNTGAFSGMTGENVIIGIIDTGIEWRHLNFMKENTTNQTRILSVWDPGLIPTGAEQGPNVALLTGGPTYGVEYTEAMINAELTAPSNPPKIRHRDCNGHGTHVAGIAAGNGNEKHKLFEKKFNYCGVAPKAKLVIVKYLYLENNPPVDNLKRFKDAISYILKIADRGGVLPPLPPQPPLPAVINCSFGSNSGPHDGLVDDGMDGEQVFLESTFSATTGKICVFAGSNDSGRRHHAIITIPAAGFVEIPFELYDPRQPSARIDYYKCRVEPNTKPLSLSFWYRNTVAGLNVQFKTPGVAAYSAAVALGAPPLINQVFDVNKQFDIFHNSTSVTRIAAPLTRNSIDISVSPHSNFHRTGTYWVKLTAPTNSVIHVWCDQKRGYGFKLDNSIIALGPIRITDNNIIGQPGDTLSVITVAAYDDTIDQMACFSSKGPLVDYSGLGVIANKPEISAPGYDILSANSYNTEPSGDNYGKSACCRTNYVLKGGTSMAAPHITGVIALMLQKKRNQTVADIKSELNNAVRARPKIYPDLQACRLPVVGVQPVATSDEAGSGKVDAKTTLNNITP